jgi:hypothetical protein
MIANGYAQGAVTGAPAALPASVGVYAFLGPTVQVTYAAGNTIHVHGVAAMGSTIAGGAVLDRLSACHQPAAGGALVDNDADWLIGLRVAQNTRHTMAVSQRISGIAAGTYNVGLCYQATAAQSGGWNSNDWVNNTVFVAQN